jgi:hypothetical protein
MPEPEMYYTFEDIMALEERQQFRAVALFNLWMYMSGVHDGVNKPSPDDCEKMYQKFLKYSEDTRIGLYFKWAFEENEKAWTKANPNWAPIKPNYDRPFKSDNTLNSEGGRRWHEALSAAAVELGRYYLDQRKGELTHGDVLIAVKSLVYEYVFKGSLTAWEDGDMNTLWEKGAKSVEITWGKKGLPPNTGLPSEGLPKS